MLHVHRAERADGLIEALRTLLAVPLPDPLSSEVIAVPTRGMERWLSQRIATGLGVCANVEFPSPRRLVGDAVATAAGLDPDADPWQPERMVWPLLEVVDDALGEPWLRDLAAHLGATVETADPARQARRFASVQHVAELFDHYALQRPAMIRAWAAGRNVDAAGRALPAEARWQAELWRRLRARVAQPDPAERTGQACARLREEPDAVSLPDRLALFGLTRLPAGRLEVLRALAAHRDVHLFLLHPSPALWERVAAHTTMSLRRAEDPTRGFPENPLLASWGHDARELQLVVGADHADHHHPTARAAGTLLERIQAQVSGDRPPQPERLDPDDRSVEVHACHGRARQVEVLRDSILHLLARDPTLEPRDVIVMCPDIEAFAPLVQATFGAGETAGGEDEELPAELRPPDLRVRLADRSLRQTNPVLGFVDRLLELAGQRLTASQVLDLADREPVRRRFRFGDDDLARLEEWVSASGIRWGLDAAHRAPFKLDALDAGTWRAGIDRVLLGVAMTEEEQRLFGDVLPLDDVESGAIDLAGRLAELVDRLHAALDAMASPMTVPDWAATIGSAADALTATGPAEAWQRAELQRLLGDVVAEASAATTRLALAEVRALLAGRLQGRPTRTNFRTGHLTICTLVPMRSVPHRVVCLLGLDDGEFPRKAPRDGDDLVLDDPHVGDRDPRAEDRQLLLDALMAATERLVVTYTGKDERTNMPRPPAVPVGELLDVVDAAAGARAREQVLVRHPLQPFDPRNFAPGALVPGRPWGFDRVTLEGARAMGAGRTPPGPFLPRLLPEVRGAVVELDDLVRFVQHPVRAFLRQRLGIVLAEHSDDIADSLTVELDELERWGVGQRLLDGRLAGAGMAACIAAERARGLLPPGRLGAPVVAALRPTLEEIGAHAAAFGDGRPRSADVRVVLDGGAVVSGTVAGLHGELLRSVTYARVNARQRLALWVRWLALTASGRVCAAALVGRARSGVDAQVTIARLPEGEPEHARAQLAALVDLRRRGLREPLPLACRTSAAYVEGGELAARRAWESGWNFPKEDVEPEHRLAFGRQLTFAELLSARPRDDEQGDGWDASETTRFGRLARRLWSGLGTAERVSDA